MKWFGPAWPSEDLRAAVCEDDSNKVPTPVGQECTLCTEDILEGDRGVILAHLEIGDAMPMVQKRAAHLDCLVGNIGGPYVERRPEVDG